MISITLKFSYKFKRYLALCNNVFRKIDKIKLKEHKEFMNLLEKYKLFYIYKHFFVDNPEKHLKLPKYEIKNHITFYKQKTVNINEFSTLPFYNNMKERIIYYFYEGNPINWSLNIHHLVKNLSKEYKVDIKKDNSISINNVIKDLLLTSVDNLQYELMILDNFQENMALDDISEITSKNYKLNDKSKIYKLLSLTDEKFISYFEIHQLYKELINNKHKLQNIRYIEETEIIFEDCFDSGFSIIYYPNNKDFIYKLLVIWEYIIKKNASKEWSEISDKIYILLENKKELRSLINKTKSKLKTFNDLLTVSHTVS